MPYRTHTCGELTAAHLGAEISLAGWTARVRDLGGLVFLDLRDKHGKTQIVAGNNDPLAEVIRTLNNEDVVRIMGSVRHRPEGMVNKDMITGEIEVPAASVEVLSRSAPLPLGVEEVDEGTEELRLKYRYLDMRRQRLQRNLALRHRALQSVRRFHDEAGFIEVETPFLIRSTPEGARDYIVPSRIHRGSFYALPQSPQIYKQTLMLGGIDRYFQIVRCFRDEDLRRDRQPEFTQIDLEMSFIDEEDVFAHTEKMMQRLVKDVTGRIVEIPFKRLSYAEAIAEYGSDAPDTRYGLWIKRADELFRGAGFNAFEAALNRAGAVLGMRAEGKGGLSRRERDNLAEIAREYGLAGLLAVPVSEAGATGVIAKTFSPERARDLLTAFDARPGDLLLFAAGHHEQTLVALGRLRRRLANDWKLAEADELAFCWVVNAPLFEKLPDSDALTAVHHPFTAPVPEDVAKMETDPLAVRSRAYDLVLNGIELATGSIRIHDSELQKRLFRVIGIDGAAAAKRFGFLLEALTYGAPPHGGIALGFDRIVMLLAGESSIKEVIAFPKTNTAYSLMDDSPSEVDEAQLQELGLKLSKSSKGLDKRL